MPRKLTGLVFAAALLVIPMIPAMGHVGIEPSEVNSGSGVTISFRIGHGCDHEPTTSVAVRIPAGVVSVSPFPKPGWDLTVETGNLAEPVDTGGQTVSEGVTTVTWSGGRLEDAHTDVFEIRATLYGEVGERVYFPVLQGCDEGEYAWIEIPADGQDPHSLASPAPALTLAAAGASHGDDVDDGGTDLLTYLALAMGSLGLVVAAFALFRRPA